MAIGFRNILRGLGFLIGILLLVWIIRKIGFAELEESFRLLGWRMLVPIVIIFPCYLLYTASWDLFLRRFSGYSISFWKLFEIKTAGETASAVTPANFLGGDPLRVWLLSKNFPVEISGASVVVDRTLQTLALVFLIFLGNVAAIFELDFPPYVKNILVVTSGFLLFLTLWALFQQSRGLFGKLAGFAMRLKIKKFSPQTLKKIGEMDDYLRDFYAKDRPLFLLCTFLIFISRLIGILEIWFLGWVLGVPMGFWGAVFFSAVIPIINIVGTIVPGSFGVLEGAISSMFLALHWDPASGLVLQIARRVRALFWYGLGALFIILFKVKKKKIKEIIL